MTDPARRSGVSGSRAGDGQASRAGGGSRGIPMDMEWTERIRSALLDAALRAWEDAGVQGLCMEGRWEAAVDAMRRLDLRLAVEAL